MSIIDEVLGELEATPPSHIYAFRNGVCGGVLLRPERGKKTVRLAMLRVRGFHVTMELQGAPDHASIEVCRLTIAQESRARKILARRCKCGNDDPA